jgi:hypothetical protein
MVILAVVPQRAGEYRFVRVTSVLIMPRARTCVALVLATPGRSAIPRQQSGNTAGPITCRLGPASAANSPPALAASRTAASRLHTATSGITCNAPYRPCRILAGQEPASGPMSGAQIILLRVG